jgi:hypothetical protein
MKNLFLSVLIFVVSPCIAQNNDCGEQLIGCSTPAFPIVANQGNNSIVDFTPGSISCPSTPSAAVSPNGSGCMATGEDNSTFIIITVTSNGTLAFNLGAAGGTGFFDWILWPYTGPGTCTDLQNGTVPPVSCNWNASNSGFTGLGPTLLMLLLERNIYYVLIIFLMLMEMYHSILQEQLKSLVQVWRQ